MEEKIILFPNFEENIIKKINNLMKETKFQEAADILEELTVHDKGNFELNSRLMQCYIHLNQSRIGLSFIEELITDKMSDHYVDYFQYYLMMLTEESQFKKVMDEIKSLEIDTKTIDKNLIDQYYLYAKEQMENQYTELLSDIDNNLKRGQIKTVFRLLFKWQALELDIPKEFESYIQADIHPILKTKMLLLMKEKKYDKALTIQKFTEIIVFTGSELKNISKDAYGSMAFKVIEEIESENPTLYQLVLELLHQYLYVVYPLAHSEKMLKLISEQIIEIAKFNLGIKSSLTPNPLANDIISKIKLYEEIV